MNNKYSPVVYISGPMTGKSDFGRAEFNAAEKDLKEAGYRVINPAMLPLGMEYATYMRIALPMVDAADIIAVLPDWDNSRGAIAEVRYAESLQKKIVSFEKLLSVSRKGA